MARRAGGPPRLARALLRLLIPSAVWEELDGDLLERYARLRRSRGRFRADLWYGRQVVGSHPLGIRRALRHARPAAGGRAQPLAGLGLDLTRALRGLRVRKGPSLTVMATIALAVGATTSVFSVVNGVLLRPLDYPDAERLVRVWQTRPGWARHESERLRSLAGRVPVSLPAFHDWTRARTALESAGLYGGHSWTLRTSSGAESLSGAIVTSGVFTTLGVEPRLGRRVLPDDDVPGAPAVAVLSFGLWRDRFGGSPDVLGTVLDLSGAPHTIVGVMPPGFHLPERRDELWTGLPEDVETTTRDDRSYNVLGRMRPGATLSAAEADLRAVQERISASLPQDEAHLGVRVVSLLDSVVGGVRPTLLFLLGAVGLVLVVACVNVANVLSVVGLSRRRELALRVALGAGKGRLTRGQLVESAVLAALGGVAGIVLAWTALPVLVRSLPLSLPRRSAVAVDGTVLAFGLGVAALAALLAGILPALEAGRVEPRRLIHARGRGSTGGTAGQRTRSALVMAEIALAFTLMAAAGLLGTSYNRLWSEDRGFGVEGLVSMYIYPDPMEYPDAPARARFVSELRRRLSSLPGIEVTAANNIPLGGSVSSTSYELERTGGDVEEISVVISVVLDNYHEVMRIPLLEGRTFTAEDGADGPQVALVNQALARRSWPGEPAVGRRLRKGAHAPWITVVGVVADVRHQTLAEIPEPKLYLPATQTSRVPAEWALRTRGGFDQAVTQARTAVAEISPGTPVRSPKVLGERISASVAVPRFRTGLVLALAGIASLLALLGLYGVVAWTVSERLKELAVRVALGAEPRRVLAGTVAEAFRLSAGGVLLGALLTAAGTRFIEQFLYGVQPSDPLTYAGTATAVALVTVSAAWFPAHRAARVDPLQLLREE